MWRCLQQKLYHEGVVWQNKERLFIFSSKDDEDVRKEPWQGKVTSKRIVFERTRKIKKPAETLYCKHLAFDIGFKRYGKNWYLLVKPEWFFSYNGYKKSYYHADKTDWLRRREDNSQVMYQLKFLIYFITKKPTPDLFESQFYYPYLNFGELVKFDSSPFLDDNQWNPAKAKDIDFNESVESQISLF